MAQVCGPVIAIVLVLCAVFLPVAFLGGLTGELYRQFAAAVITSVVISGIVTLTLTPTLCARLLCPRDADPPAALRWFNVVFAACNRRTCGVAAALVRRPWLAGGSLIVVVAASALFRYYLPAPRSS